MDTFSLYFFSVKCLKFWLQQLGKRRRQNEFKQERKKPNYILWQMISCFFLYIKDSKDYTKKTHRADKHFQQSGRTQPVHTKKSNSLPTSK